MIRALLLIGLWGAVHPLIAQQCSPELLEADQKHFAAGDFKPALVKKLGVLMKEILALTSKPIRDPSERSLFKQCAAKKDALFQALLEQAADPDKETAEFQELVGDYLSFHARHEQALLVYDRAVELNPKNLPLLIKDFNAFVLVEHINLNDLIGKQSLAEAGIKSLAEATRRMQRIADHPRATKADALHALAYQAMSARALGNSAQAMKLWADVLQLDPKNEIAARSRFNYFLEKGQQKDVTDEFRRLLRMGRLSDDDWRGYLALLAHDNQHDEFLSWLARAPQGFVAKNPQFKVWLAHVYLDLGRYSDAEAAQKSVGKAKLDARIARLQKQNWSRLTELAADELQAKGRHSEALEKYKQALGTSPNPLTINEKISQLIYQYRKSLNFQPPEATRKDLLEVVNLLKASAARTELKASVFEIYLHALTLTDSKSLLAAACPRYKALYGAMGAAKAYQTYCLPQAPGSKVIQNEVRAYNRKF